MAFSVKEFRSRMTKDGARPSYFSVRMNAPQWVSPGLADLEFMCKASDLPASTVGTKTISYFGHDVHFAGQRTFADWTVTVYNDEDFGLRNAFETWLNGIDQHTQSLRGSNVTNATDPYSYVGGATVAQYGKTGDVVKYYQFYNMFPTDVSAITVDWDTKDDIETFQVTFKYDYYHSVVGGTNQQITT